MSWTRIKATGSGQLHFRVQIEGFPYEPVSALDMEGTAGDDRIRYVGLQSRGIKLSERVDLPTAKWEPRGFRLTIADVNRRWTEAFKAPTAVTWLSADASSSVDTFAVKASAAFPSTGRLWCDSETVSYSGKTSTSFTGLTRGLWQTLAQKHFTTDAERLRFPEVTDWPRVREGRRVKLYVYGAGDPRSASDTGTLIWTGTVSTEPQFDGLVWKINIDPISRKWSQDVGGDLEDPAGIRGIYYPASAPLLIRVLESSNQDFGSGGGATEFAVAGFWETQAAFCAALTTTINTQLGSPRTGSFTTTVFAVPVGESWMLLYNTAGASPKYLHFGVNSATDFREVEQRVRESGGSEVNTVTSSATYEAPIDSGFPRASIGRFGPVMDAVRVLPAAFKVDINPATHPRNRVYIDGSVAITASLNAAAVEWDSSGPHAAEARSDPFVPQAVTVDASARTLTFSTLGVDIAVEAGSPSPFFAAVGHDAVEIRMGRSYGEGHLGDFITNLTAEVADNINRGAVPDIRATDFRADGDMAAWVASTDIPAAATSPLVSRRGYSVFAPVEFGAVVKEECKLAGLIPAYDSDGLITFHKIRYAAEGELTVKSITAADIITGSGKWLSFEIAPLGMFNTVELETGYDPIEDEYLGRLRRVRDVEAFGRAPDGRTLKISPKSMDIGEYEHIDVVRQMSGLLGVFGAPYHYLTFSCKLTLIDLFVGDIVQITWAKVPNATGTLGVTNKAGYVVAREWDLTKARGKLTLLLTDQDIAGYTPATKISDINGSSGTQGPFTVTADTAYFPGSSSAADFWKSGDKIRLFAYDSTSTANNVTATLDSDPATNSLTFTTDANWTHAGTTWVLGSQVSTAITVSTQRQYCYTANADLTLDFSGATGNAARTLAI